ncbi:hypothetical protein BDV95DRAFT_610554 [Massariosphaeria phaeospora]|uniref:Uncharacterized protein n=1 Tax=Massariosphaeria phaeospora TaxID=100035 RepID=A0A7C8M9R5_9PLEO|nr:hypothetical protein BDV95DRAFT_610554 [Massariosphaeria phaeospora]
MSGSTIASSHDDAIALHKSCQVDETLLCIPTARPGVPDLNAAHIQASANAHDDSRSEHAGAQTPSETSLEYAPPSADVEALEVDDTCNSLETEEGPSPMVLDVIQVSANAHDSSGSEHAGAHTPNETSLEYSPLSADVEALGVGGIYNPPMADEDPDPIILDDTSDNPPAAWHSEEGHSYAPIQYPTAVPEVIDIEDYHESVPVAVDNPRHPPYPEVMSFVDDQQHSPVGKIIQHIFKNLAAHRPPIDVVTVNLNGTRVVLTTTDILRLHSGFLNTSLVDASFHLAMQRRSDDRVPQVRYISLDTLQRLRLLKDSPNDLHNKLTEIFISGAANCTSVAMILNVDNMHWVVLELRITGVALVYDALVTLMDHAVDRAVDDIMSLLRVSNVPRWNQVYRIEGRRRLADQLCGLQRTWYT